MTDLTAEQVYKIKVIQDINDMLLRHGQESILVEDFDILWELSTDEIRDAKMNIKEQLRTISPLKRTLKTR